MKDEQQIFCMVISGAWALSAFATGIGAETVIGPGYGGFVFGAMLAVYALTATAFMFYRENHQ
jgi:hypothetical protein